MHLFSEENGYGDNAIDTIKLGWLYARHGARVAVHTKINRA